MSAAEAPPRGRVMGGLSRAVVEAAAGYHCDLTDVLARHGIERAQLDRSDTYVPVALHEELWAEAASRTGLFDLGIRAARQFNPGLTGVVEYIMRNCATVRDAVGSWLRWAPLVSDCLSGELRREDTVMVLHWQLDRPLSDGTRQWAEFAQGRTLRLIQQALSTSRIRPIEVWFRHPAPADTRPHESFFSAPVRFEREAHAMVWSPSWLDVPLKGNDPLARVALEERAEALHARLAAPRAMADVCADAILALLNESQPDVRLERVAAYLQLTPRTLQRRLRTEKRSFRRLADDVRRREAERLLVALPPAEVARRLGFSDDAALRKARRRWRLKA